MALPAWHDGVEPVTVALRVDEGKHHVTWSAGELRLDDHPDVDADLALGALGGGRCRCVDVLQMWLAQVAAPEILTVGRRARERVWVDAPSVVRMEREAKRWRTGWAATAEALAAAGDSASLARLGPAAEVAERRLARRLAFVWMLGLDEGLHDRLQLTVLAAVEARWEDAAFARRHGARLRAALAGRAVPALREAGITVHLGGVELAGPGAAASIQPDHAVLPLSWLTNVWCRGVAVSDGRFVTAITEISDGGKVLVAQGVEGVDWRVRRA